MIQIENTLLSEELFEKQFVCDLSACKGACCVEGDAGAPLEEEEIHKLEEIQDQIRPFLRKEGIEAIEKQGAWEMDKDGDYVTPLVNGKECAYVQFAEDGTTLCAIEQAYNAGAVDWKKPISCHLYPVRLTPLKDFTALNYHKWQICSAACSLGEALKVKVYQFAKDSLIRKFGEDWYEQVQEADKLLEEMKKS
ncbi:MAG: DUF3109 family protein [Flavobacteriales bacterium]|nr:DUF3109 family protein [Flavobacteriales bacterium]